MPHERDRDPRRKPQRRRRDRADDGFGPFRRTDEPRRGDGSRRPSPQPRDADGAKQRGRYRVVGKRKPSQQRGGRRAPRDASQRGRPRKRRREAPGDVRDEIVRLGSGRGPRYYDQLMKAADAFACDHERDALRLLRPLRDALPDSPSVRELLGLAHYRLGHYPAAAKELEAFAELSGSVEQHPVLMDSYRAQRRWRKVDERWRELTAASPGAELVTEGRIVVAGALADRGRVDDAIALLTRADKKVTKPKPYHLRLWYALADLEERAGNVPRARSLFERVRRDDAGFADVAERLAGLR